MTYDPGQYGQPTDPQYGQPAHQQYGGQPQFGSPGAQYGPPTQLAQPNTQNPQGSGRRPLVLAGAAGFVLAAVIALVLGVLGAWPGSGSDSGRSDSSISLPKTVDGYGRFGDVGATTKSAAAKSVAQIRKTETATAAALSKAHGGAGAAVTTYTSKDLETEFQVWAVRDASPPPVVAVQDAAYYGLAVAPQRVEKIGDVVCLIVQSQQVPAGQKVNPAYDVPSLCQRSANGLTVEFHGGPGMTPKKAAAVVDAMWSSLS